MRKDDGKMDKHRCSWCRDGGLNQNYHDNEWGIPLHDDRKQFEFLMMEVMQCGLNWTLMLKKREIFRQCFANFDYQTVAQFTDADVDRILNTEGMIKSRRKICAIIHNAQCFLRIIDEYGSFDRFIWSFTENHTYVHLKHQLGEWETKNELSDCISAALKKRGFKYLGSITVYSHLQACGIINDHEPTCWMYDNLIKNANIKFITD